MISIVITTKNNEVEINNCLSSIVKSYFSKPYEIIVVDNFSDDKTADVCKKYDVKFFQKGPERSAQRNYGIINAKYEIIIFLDSDMEISENLLNSVKKNITEKNLDALYVREIIRARGYYSKVRNFERGLYEQTPIDCVRAFKKELFIKIGMFDTFLSGPEDWDFNNKVILSKANIGFVSDPIYHNEQDGFFKTIKKKKYYSHDMQIYKNKWQDSNNLTSFQLGFLNRYFLIFFYKKNFYKVIKRPDLFICMYIAKIIIGAFYLMIYKN